MQTWENPPVVRETAVVLEPTWALCTKIWWSFAWRFIVFIFPLSVLIGGVFGYLAGIVHLSRQGYMFLGFVLSAIFFTILHIRGRLKKPFKRFKIILVAVPEKQAGEL